LPVSLLRSQPFALSAAHSGRRDRARERFHLRRAVPLIICAVPNIFREIGLFLGPLIPNLRNVSQAVAAQLACQIPVDRTAARPDDMFSFNGSVEPAFKRVPDGWIFRGGARIIKPDGSSTMRRAPWSVRYYLVNEAQKAELARLLRQELRRFGLYLIASVAGTTLLCAAVWALMFSIAPLSAWQTKLSPLGHFAVAFASFALPLWTSLFLLMRRRTSQTRRAMARILADAAETSERIGFIEQQKRYAETVSVGGALCWLAICLLLIPGSFNSMMQRLPLDAKATFGQLLFLSVGALGTLFFSSYAAFHVIILFKRAWRHLPLHP
jgi:hypothetical protein